MSGCSMYNQPTYLDTRTRPAQPHRCHSPLPDRPMDGCAHKVPGFGNPSSDKSEAAGLSFHQPRLVVQLRPRTPRINTHCRVVQLQGSMESGAAWGRVLFGVSMFFILAAAANFHKQPPQPACGGTLDLLLSVSNTMTPPSSIHSSVCVCVCVCVCPSASSYHLAVYASSSVALPRQPLQP